MRAMARRAARVLACEAGAVALEYVLLTTLIILPLVGISGAMFSARGRMFDASGPMERGLVRGQDFGYVGNQFVGWYQRILCGLGVPVP